MAKRKRKDLSTLVVVCEWGSCTFQGHSMEELSEHMSVHLREHLGERDALEELDDYACLWKGCEFLAMGSPRELEIHAHFHNFHGKLKFIGEQLLKSHPEFPSCTQDLHSSNLVPEIPEELVCQWEHCDSTFNNPEWFYRHVEMHIHCTDHQPLPDQQQAIFCNWKDCETFYKIKYRLKEHLRSHTGERLVACPTCGCMFSCNTKFFDHIHRQALPEESLVCGKCDKGFANERLLRDHVRQHVNNVKCPLCDMTCTTLATLKIHIKFRHCDERPFPCDFCESSFKNTHDLRKHTETHNEGAYHCTVEGCGYTSQTAHTMNQHYKRVHEQGGMSSKYKCHLCDKTFSWSYTLTLHLRNKHHLKWPSGHSRFRYKEDEDGYLKLNMVRYETVEVTQEIMKNMARKKRSAQRRHDSGSRQAKRAADTWGDENSSSSSSSYSELSAEEDTAMSGQPSPRGNKSPVYCVVDNVPDMGEDESDSCGPSGAVRALTEVARGLGMDVV